MASQPPPAAHLVVGMLDHDLRAEDVTDVTVLASAAIACMAAIGNGDGAIVERILRSVVPVYRHLPESARDTVGTIADELAGAALAGKHFMAVGRIRVVMPEAERGTKQ